MALEQKLSLKLSQKLVMTPSLQQAIKLLQMTRLELEGVINEELIENPLLEDAQLENEEPEEVEEKPEEAEDPMDDIDLDAYFNDYLDVRDNSTANSYEQREAVPLENTLSSEPDLYDYLMWQLRMSDLSGDLRRIAELIIGNLDGDGFLMATVEELQLLGAEAAEVEAYREARAAWERLEETRLATIDDSAGAAPGPLTTRAEATEVAHAATPSAAVNEPGSVEHTALQETEGSSRHSVVSPSAGAATAVLAGSQPPCRPTPPGFSRAAVERGLEYIRSLDPPGIGCANLRESLCLQLESRGDEDTIAFRLVNEFWTEFLKRQYAQIAKQIGIPLKDLEEPVEEIKSLETRPGRRYNNTRTQYVEPDVAVVKVGDEYIVQLNDDGMPRLRVSRAYRQMLRNMKQEGRQGDAQAYIKEKMRSAMWLIKSLDQRQRTIYKVATSIVKQQQDFLERGIEHLRPMVLRDVAEDIGMHESTVSRVVSNKYIHTPRGLHPMKFFFHSGIDRDYGEDISSLTVKRKIQGFVHEEDDKKPLSDSEIMRMLNREGIKIARRTVAKYRDELAIPSSTDRKKIF